MKYYDCYRLDIDLEIYIDLNINLALTVMFPKATFRHDKTLTERENVCMIFLSFGTWCERGRQREEEKERESSGELKYYDSKERDKNKIV